MLRSMFSGVSGLRSHQTMVDVIGNNIANVNTAGFKSSSVVFQDLLSQVLTGAGVPTATAGGTNPAQVGLGVKIAGISTNFTGGASQLTGSATDLSIQGDGFFVVRQGAETLYTRAGALAFDATGRLTSADGSIVQGWIADATGAINTNAASVDLSMPLGQTLAPSATTSMALGGNLDASSPIGQAVVTAIKVYDQLGTPISVSASFTRTAANTWDFAVDTNGDGTFEAAGSLAFDGSTGALLSPNPSITMLSGNFPGGITVDLGAPGSANALTQFAGETSVAAISQDGYDLGSLQSFAIGQDGIVTGVFSNGRNRPLGRIALGSFTNPMGLEKAGGSLFRPTVNSGLANIGVAGAGGRGTLLGSTLEMSNVDLAREFTNLIIAQRGFQANSRVITASDELLQDLVNLKR
ncbi:MAG: flagellar hook protein FlgE [Actinomycetota bacterium]|nr:flagellar hook protein FlgE [Actinomycetota bacterium]